MTGRWWLLALLTLGCAQSGGVSVAPAGVGGAMATTFGGASAAGSSATMGEAAAGFGGLGSAGAGDVEDPNLTPDGFPRCGELYPARADDCEGIEQLTVSAPDVSSNVFGTIQPGLSMTSVDVWLENTGELEYDNVCVGVMSDTPGITLTGYQRDAPIPLLIDHVKPREGFDVAVASLSVGAVAPGTTARFSAWTTFEGSNCLGPVATVDALVE